MIALMLVIAAIAVRWEGRGGLIAFSAGGKTEIWLRVCVMTERT